MVTQEVKFDLLNQKQDKPILCRYGEDGRTIYGTIINSDDEEHTVNLNNFTGIKIQMYKPDGNFIIKDATVSSGHVVIPIDEQMTASAGTGFMDLKLTAIDGTIYTCHATVIIDTPVATDDTITSVSLVDGYIFPDDFQLKLTAGDNITIDEDNVISATGGGGGGTGDYTDLINKPRINNVILTGNKTTAQLGLPTKTSDIENDSGFITSAVNNLANYYKKTETYSQTEVNALIGSIASLTLSVVSVLPDHDISTSTIYLVPKDVPGTDDVYDEYVYVNSNWEHIGSTTADLTDYYTISQVNTLLAGKVDKETGKGLSTNDFTTAEKNKLAGIQAGAEVNVQADWNQTDVDADDYIKNKPSIGVYTAGNGIDITNSQISVSTPLLNQISETATNLGQPATYDSTASYSVGDVCEHDGYCYKCNTPITGGETWDSDHWDATDAWEQVDALNQSLEELITTDTTTATTTASGNIGLPITTSNAILLNVTATTNSRLAIPWENSGVYTVKILKADLSIAASESVTVRYSYKTI